LKAQLLRRPRAGQFIRAMRPWRSTVSKARSPTANVGRPDSPRGSPPAPTGGRSPGDQAPRKPRRRPAATGGKPNQRLARGKSSTGLARSPGPAAGQPPALLPAAALPPAGSRARQSTKQNAALATLTPSHWRGSSLGCAPPKRVDAPVPEVVGDTAGTADGEAAKTQSKPDDGRPPEAPRQQPEGTADGWDHRMRRPAGLLPKRRGRPQPRKGGADVHRGRLGGGARPFEACTV